MWIGYQRPMMQYPMQPMVANPCNNYYYNMRGSHHRADKGKYFQYIPSMHPANVAHRWSHY